VVCPSSKARFACYFNTVRYRAGMSFRNVYGYDWSENGWRMCNRDECSLPISPGMTFIDTAPIRKGPPLVILSAWLKYYDTQIAEIVSPVWGWSATNDVPSSNHLSGTALDINAPQWPWGERRMPAALKEKIRRGLALFEGTVFWGADWSRADEMHFQMALREGDPRNAAFAAKLSDGYLGLLAPGAGPTPTPQEDDEMPSAKEIAKAVWEYAVGKPDGGKEQAGLLLGWVDQHTGDTLDQLAGPETRSQRTGAKGPLRPTGWPELAKQSKPTPEKPSLVDGVASKSDIARLEEKLDSLARLITPEEQS
jgi:hypothetical protein